MFDLRERKDGRKNLSAAVTGTPGSRYDPLPPSLAPPNSGAFHLVRKPSFQHGSIWVS